MAISEAGTPVLSGAQLAAKFNAVDPLTVGIEEEVMLLHPATFDLWPGAAEVLGRLAGDPRFKAELPASQLEIITEPAASSAEALEALAAGRRDLANAARGLALPGVAGVHPFAAPDGELTGSSRYRRIRERYGPVARRQLVASLQVHVALGDASTTLSVHNALRGYLPEVAALAANAAFHAGEDTGMASIRPNIAETLPRQGVPPRIEDWDTFSADLHWGKTTGWVPEPRMWWWELRPNATYGTLEVRVPDAQTTLGDAAGVTAFIHSLVVWLHDRAAAGERLPAPDSWRIEENRWSAARFGLDGEMADLKTGELEPTRQRLERLLNEVEPYARQLGNHDLIGHARQLTKVNGALHQRQIAAQRGIDGLAQWLAESFLEGPTAGQRAFCDGPPG